MFNTDPIIYKIKNINFTKLISLGFLQSTNYLQLKKNTKKIVYILNNSIYKKKVNKYINFIVDGKINNYIDIFYILLIKKKIFLQISNKILIYSNNQLKIEFVKKFNYINIILYEKIITFLKKKAKIIIMLLAPKINYYRQYIHNFLNGKNTKLQFYNLSILNNTQENNLQHITHHNNHNTASLIISRAILLNKSQFTLYIKDNVTNNMRNINIQQQSHNILLTLNSNVIICPHMEIKSHSIKCKHEVTISYVINKELLYLQTRGLHINVAYILLLMGFIAVVIKQAKLLTQNIYHHIQTIILKNIIPQDGLEPTRKLFFEEF